VLVVVTFRSDSLHRDDPLRRLLAGLERVGGVTRLELARLSRDQVAAQIEGVLGRPPAPSIVNAVYERVGGNPLFTEALLNPDGTVRPDLPWTLRDLLLATVKDLPGQTQQLLRTAAVGGHRVGHALLAAVAGSDDDALTAGLRPAVAANVLVSDTDGYAFRHELIREAVLGDLLPGERAQAHRRFAEALESAPSLSPDGAAAVQMAQHWLGARDVERALTAAWRAAAGAGASFTYAEQLLMGEQVLALWDQVPDPARQTGTDHLSVLMVAADAARWAGEPERGLALVEAALAEAGRQVMPMGRRHCCGGGPACAGSCGSPASSMTCKRHCGWQVRQPGYARRSSHSCAGRCDARTVIKRPSSSPGSSTLSQISSAMTSAKPKP
jgi:hypothetical protein